jgi:phage protein
MDEKILVTLPEHIANYLEYMKSFKYSIMGALNMSTSKYVSDGVVRDWLDDSANQEKFALAWINGYKREEKFYLVKFKNFGNVYSYLNYEIEEKIFKLSSKEETKYFQTKFTKKFLEENSFGWVLGCECVELIEVEQ